jgi:hypothetical protein
MSFSSFAGVLSFVLETFFGLFVVSASFGWIDPFGNLERK